MTPKGMTAAKSREVAVDVKETFHALIHIVLRLRRCPWDWWRSWLARMLHTRNVKRMRSPVRARLSSLFFWRFRAGNIFLTSYISIT